MTNGTQAGRSQTQIRPIRLWLGNKDEQEEEEEEEVEEEEKGEEGCEGMTKNTGESLDLGDEVIPL